VVVWGAFVSAVSIGAIFHLKPHLRNPPTDSKQGFIPPALHTCYQYLASLGPQDAIDYNYMSNQLSDMGSSSYAQHAQHTQHTQQPAAQVTGTKRFRDTEGEQQPAAPAQRVRRALSAAPVQVGDYVLLPPAAAVKRVMKGEEFGRGLAGAFAAVAEEE